MNPGHPSEAEIFDRAAELSGEARVAYLAQACAGDDQLRQRVENLLASHQDAEAGAFMGKSPVASAKTLLITTNLIPVTEKAGDKIGRYKLREQIGEGGCGVVYVAEQEEPVRRRVALKVIKLGMDTKQVVARFEAERQALALMDHPNIAKVLDAGATDTGRPYFVMELVRGIKITDYCDQNNLSTEERLKLFIQVCAAIQHAHQKGIIHRDIKPSNILVTLHDGVPVPKVIDFGIAKATSDQRLTDKTVYTAFEQFIGTPAYMSPEQAEMSGLDIDTRSDIYSLGVLLYELLTGRTPFDSTTLLQAGLDQMRRIIREQEPQRPSTRLSILEAADLTTIANHRQAEPPKLVSLISGDLDWIVMKSLEKDRTRRYETATGLAVDLQRHLSNEPVAARPPSAAYRFRKVVRRNRTIFATSGAILLLLVVGIAVSTWQALRATRAERSSVMALDELRRTAPAFAEQARTLATQERFTEAIDAIDYAIKLRPRDPEYLITKASLLLSQLRLKEAADAYGSALQTVPNHVQAKANFALCNKILSANQDGHSVTRENLQNILEVMQKEQRPAAELILIARELGREKEFLRASWLARLKGLPITPDRPLEQRLKYREDGLLELDLSDTPISDLSPIREFPLECLKARKTRVKTLDSIQGSVLARNLREVFLSDTDISDLSPLADCVNLEILGVANTLVSSLETLRDLPIKHLYIAGTAVTNLAPLKNLPLKQLYLGYNPGIQDVKPLAEIKTLKGVILPSPVARNIESLRALPLARIGYNYIANGGPDKTAQEFWADWDKKNLPLKMWHTQLKDLPIGPEKPLEERLYYREDGLLELDLSKTGVADLTQVRELPLDCLILSKTRIQNLDAIRGSVLSHSLRSLKVDDTEVCDLSPLRDCIKLAFLGISKTRIASLEALHGLPIQSLYIYRTPVTNLAQIQGLPLEEIFLGECPNIADVKPLAGIKTLKKVVLPSPALLNIEALRQLPLTRIGFDTVRPGVPEKTAQEFWADWDKRNAQSK